MTGERALGPELSLLVTTLLGGSEAGSASEIDWRRFAALAGRHRVEGLLWRAIADGEVHPPAEIAHAIEAANRDWSLTFLAQLGETARIVRLLDENSIAAISLKGCTLALELYAPRPELRNSIDIDLLVAPATYDKAQDVLRRAGYVRKTPAETTPASADSMARHLLNASAFERADDGIRIELHHRLLDPYLFNVDFAELLANARSVTVGDTRVRTLGCDDLAVYLCAHAAMHAFFRLKWLVDLVALFDRIGEAGIVRALARASDVGCRRHVELALLMSERFAGRRHGPLSERARVGLDGLARRASAAMVGEARESSRFAIGDVAADLVALGYALRLAPGWPSRRHEILWHLVNHKDLSVLRLSREWVLLYAALGRPLALGRWLLRSVARPEAP